jgi:DNA recombination protein RmuC
MPWNKGVKKPLQFKRLCKVCGESFLSADNSKANLCLPCKKPRPCLCGCGLMASSAAHPHRQGHASRIDSKFSLDNYQRCIDSENDDDKKFYADEFKKDLKNRIVETSKYIRESEDTMPIAFMFIPSEAIYYDLLAGEQSRIKVNTQALQEFAQKQKVIIVSPTSILAYLHLVVSGVKAFKLEKDTEQIKKKVEDLGRHIQNYEEFYKKLGASLSTTVNHYTKGYDELRKIDKDVYKITDGVAGGAVEVLRIEKPQIEE